MLVRQLIANFGFFSSFAPIKDDKRRNSFGGFAVIFFSSRLLSLTHRMCYRRIYGAHGCSTTHITLMIGFSKIECAVWIFTFIPFLSIFHLLVQFIFDEDSLIHTCIIPSVLPPVFHVTNISSSFSIFFLLSSTRFTR